jgi:hypothetical protein
MDVQIDGGKVLTVVKGSSKGDSHGSIRQGGYHATMHPTHRIVPPLIHFNTDRRLT